MAKKYNINKLEPHPIDPISDIFGEGIKERQIEALENEIKESRKNQVQHISIEKLHPYSNHYFHKPEGEDWESFVESIKQQGILQPIIVRQHPEYENEYQIIAGHCRTEGAKEVGLDVVPAIVMNIEDDVEASILVGLTNKQREHISDVEWGRTYRETYELMKRQGERIDLTCGHSDHKLKENVFHDEINYEKETCARREHKLKRVKTLDILAEKYGISRAVIQRKIRLSYLIPSLARAYEEKIIKQSVAVNLSYLTEAEQDYVNTYIFCEKIEITEDMAKELKALSQEANKRNEELTVNDIGNVIIPEGVNGNKEGKDRKEKAKKYEIPDTYFPDNIKQSKKVQYIISALNYVKENNIDLNIK